MVILISGMERSASLWYCAWVCNREDIPSAAPGTPPILWVSLLAPGRWDRLLTGHYCGRQRSSPHRRLCRASNPDLSPRPKKYPNLLNMRSLPRMPTGAREPSLLSIVSPETIHSQATLTSVNSHDRGRAVAGSPAGGLGRLYNPPLGWRAVDPARIRLLSLPSARGLNVRERQACMLNKFCLVRKRGVEPLRVLPHRILNPARLPVPPLSRRLLICRPGSFCSLGYETCQDNEAWIGP
jgi:hypothetical protein